MYFKICLHNLPVTQFDMQCQVTVKFHFLQQTTNLLIDFDNDKT